MTDRAATIRLDRFLWFARLVKTRAAAQELAQAGTLRLDGRRIERASALVRIGSVVAFPLRGRVRVMRVEALPKRRGPASEAATLYQELLPDLPPAPSARGQDDNVSQQSVS